MSSGVRASASAAMLAGFLAVAGLQLALVVVPVLLVLAMLPGNVALRLGVPLCIATVGVMAYATWRALRTRRPVAVGFGAACYLLFLVPFVAVVTMPSAVAGAAMLSRDTLGSPAGPPAD